MLELLIVMGIFMIVIAAASQMFVSLLSDYKQQSKITVTNIEGILGLEMMRRDIENAGYGLPWEGLPSAGAYAEVGGGGDAEAIALNDAPPNAPRAIVSRNDTGWHETDRLVVKAINVAMNSTSEHWNFLYTTPAVATNVWRNIDGTPAADNLLATDRIIVISQDANSRRLLPYTGIGGGFSSTFSNVASFSATRSDPSIVYGVDPNTPALKMPFNRADYYVQPPVNASDLPRYCAAGTGILYKAVIENKNTSTGFLTAQPLLECVADMQVAFLRDLNGDGTAEDHTEDLTGSTAQDIRNQVREVRVYILAQEGQRDRNYTYPNQVVRVGETGGIVGTVGRDFNLNVNITDWSHYRWKLYTLVVRPSNLQ